MARRAGRSFSVALLLTVLVSGTAAATISPEQQAYGAVVQLMDRLEWKKARIRVAAALRQYAGSRDDYIWALHVAHGEIVGAEAGDWGRARELLRRVPPPRLRTSEAEVRRLLLLAIAEKRLLKRDPRPLIADAEAIAQRHQPRALGLVYTVRASLVDKGREANAKAALAFARKHGDTINEVRALNDLVRHCIANMRSSDALRLGEEALKLTRAARLDGFTQKLEGNLGWMYLEIGDVETAAEYFKRADEVAGRLGAINDRVMWISQRGVIHFESGDYDEAERRFREALHTAIEVEHNDAAGTATHNLAKVSLVRGRAAEALVYAEQSLAFRREVADRTGLVYATIVKARALMALSRTGEARELLEAAVDAKPHPAAEWEARGRLGELHLRTGRFEEARREFDVAIATARRTRESLGAAERFSFFRTIDEIFDTYIDALVERGLYNTALAVAESIRAQSLADVLETRRGGLDARALAKQRGATILCYWLGRKHSYLWRVTEASIDIRTLPPERVIGEAVAAYQRDLHSQFGTIKRSGARGQQLYSILVAPAVPKIARGSRVVLVLDSHLHALNFETLVAPSPRPHYWIEDVVLTNAPSLQLLRGAAKHEAKPSPAMLLIGDPQSSVPSFRRLPQARAEMDRISRYFNHRTVLDGANATPEAYRKVSPSKFDFVHFVAHGEAPLLRPLDSAVILSRGSDDQYRLSAQAILKQPIRARLVTISSCHGAGKRAFVGEGLVGLSWAFLGAGARQVIAALWEVNDEAAPELMNAMYAAIRNGRDPAVALRDAKLTLIRNGGAYKRPYYWAPFVLYET